MAQQHGNEHTPRGLTAQKAAQYVGVSVNAFSNLVAEGHLPVPINIGGHLLWDRHSIDRYFDVAGAKTPDLKAWHELMLIAFPEYAAAQGVGAESPEVRPTWTRKKYEHWYEMPEGPERDRRQAREEAEERAEIRRSPMGKWERVALWELYRHRGKPIDAGIMRGVTFRTHERLKARGYVSIKADRYGHARFWKITPKGIEAIKGIPEEQPPELRKE